MLSNFYDLVGDFFRSHWESVFSGVGVVVIGGIYKFLLDAVAVLRAASGNRRIAREWHGTVAQDLNSADGTYVSTCHITFSRWFDLRGLATIHYKDTHIRKSTAHTLKLKGVLMFDSCFKFEFRTTDKTIHQFGTMILILSGDTKRLSGVFASYGPMTNSPVCGTLQLEAQR